MSRINFCSVLIAMFFLSGIQFSCKKYLDEKPDKGLVVPEKLADLQGLLDDNTFMNTLTPGFGEASSDDYFVTENSYNSSLNEPGKLAYTWRLNSYNYGQADWGYCHLAIYNANYCLEQLEKIQRTSQNAVEWDNVKGSSLFFRAYYFLGLVWDYGKAYDQAISNNELGIPLRLTTNINEPSERASVQACYDRIISDAKGAAELLTPNSTHVIRPSNIAAYGLLARAYLSMRIYEEAFKYADLALGIKNDLLDYNDPSINTNSNTPFLPFNNEMIFYSTQTTTHAAKNPSLALVDTTLYSKYDNNDRRKLIYFGNRSGYKFFKGNYNRRSRFVLFTGLCTDELYLIRSECNARLGRVEDALDDLNTLLAARWVTGTFTPISGLTQQQAIDTILLERRKELLMRGLRWIDIKRLNKEGTNIVLHRVIGSENYDLQPNGDKFALPLPTDIITITGMPQNPGWD